MTYLYRVYGLTLSTTFPCPVLNPAAAGSDPDICVIEGVVPHTLENPAFIDPESNRWEVEKNRYLFRGGAHAGRFLVENGTQVTLQRNPAAEDKMLAFYFLDTVLSMLLQQRGMLVLHANAAITGGKAIAVSGVSGMGKSTTLAALIQRGCSMLTDDITALRLASDGTVETLPGIPQMHLTEDSASALGEDISAAPRYPWRRMKAAVHTAHSMAEAPAPLRALYLLDVHEGDELILQPQSGLNKFLTLQDCIFGPMLPEEHPDKFKLFNAIVQSVQIYRVYRPAKRWSADELADRILADQA